MKSSENSETSKPGFSFSFLPKAANNFFSSLSGNEAENNSKSQKASLEKQELLYSARKEKGLRNRKSEVKSEWRKNEDQMLYHQEQQEQLANDMINLTKVLKHNAVMSKKIIKEDIKNLEKANKATESNYNNMQSEAGRLKEHMDKSSCWMYSVLLIVFIVFIAMIIFIRFFPK